MDAFPRKPFFSEATAETEDGGGVHPNLSNWEI